MTTSTFFERWLVRACFCAGWAAADRLASEREYDIVLGSDARAEACERFLNGEDFAEAVRQAADTPVTESTE